MVARTRIELRLGLGRIHHSAEKKDAARMGVADQEDEGMVGPKNGRWPRRHHHGHGPHNDAGCRGGHRARFVNLHDWISPVLAPLPRFPANGLTPGKGGLQAAETFVLPSHQENFGIAVAEALSCGTPVLITHPINISPEIGADGGGLVEEDTLPGFAFLLHDYGFGRLAPGSATG